MINKGSEKNKKNNTFIAKEKYNTKSKGSPVSPIEVFLHKNYGAPKGKFDWSVRIRNRSSNPLYSVQIKLLLKSSKGKEVQIADQNINIPVNTLTEKKSFLAKFSDTYPDFTAGKYYVLAKISWFDPSTGKNVKFRLISFNQLTYEPAKLKIKYIKADSPLLVSKNPLNFYFSVENQGKITSTPEKFKIILAGERVVSLGTVQVKALVPSKQSYVFRHQVTIPKNIRKGLYSLNIQKAENFQGENQQVGFSTTMKVVLLRLQKPYPLNRFSQNQIPNFQWFSSIPLKYRVVLSTDKTFKDSSQIMKMPADHWSKEKQRTPKNGEWRMAWLLTNQGKKKLYWRVEAKTKRGRQYFSENKLIQFKTQ